LCELFSTDHPLGRGGFRYVQRYHVDGIQQFVQGAHLLGVTDWQFGDYVVEVHVHAQAFSHYRQLSTDRTVTDDTQFFATDFVRVVSRLVPAATVALSVTLRNAAHQHDDFSDGQFGYGTGVGIRCVEYGDTTLGGRFQINLVGTNAETTHGDQFFGGGKDIFGQLGAGADTNEVRIFDTGFQLVIRQGCFQILNVGVAGRMQCVERRLVYAFQQKELDLAFIEGGLSHGSTCEQMIKPVRQSPGRLRRR